MWNNRVEGVFRHLYVSSTGKLAHCRKCIKLPALAVAGRVCRHGWVSTRLTRMCAIVWLFSQPRRMRRSQAEAPQLPPLHSIVRKKVRLRCTGLNAVERTRSLRFSSIRPENLVDRNSRGFRGGGALSETIELTSFSCSAHTTVRLCNFSVCTDREDLSRR